MNIIEILTKLVSFNTIRDKENALIISFIENYLKNLGFITKKVDKCLIAKNSNNPKIGFIGHTDTVDFDTWDGNPFKVQIKEGKIYGLGVCDMKGGIAAILSTLSEINLNKNKIALYFTYDEEISFKGIKSLSNEIFPDTIIIGEPTNNIPIYGTKGILVLIITFKGIKTHSSTPEKGKSAIYECINFINELKQYYDKLKLIKYPKFEVDYTSMNVGTIKGGESTNSVPGNCQIEIDFRVADNKQIAIIEKDIKKILTNYDAKVTIKNKVKTSINLDDISFLEKISSKKETANYITEASFITSKSIIIGPGPITAHEKNEYITIDSLEETKKLYKEIIRKYNS